MTSDRTKPMLPEAVYFDANALWQLSHGVSNVDFIELRDMSEQIRAGLFSPEVAVREWAQKLHEEALAEINKLRTAARNLGLLLDRDALKHDEPANIETIIRDKVTEYLTLGRVESIPTPKDIQLESLIEMAIRKEPPFEKRREKGFRDTVILLTIMDHMRSNGFSNTLFISEDKIFGHKDIKTRLGSQGLNMVVASKLVDAKDHISAQLDGAVKSYLEKKRERLHAFLSSKFDEISNFVLENAEVSEFFIRGGLFSKDWRIPWGSIKEVLAVRPKKISNVYPGVALTKKPHVEGAEYITFSVATEFEIIYVEQGSLFDQPTFPLGAPEDFEKIEYRPSAPTFQQTTRIRDITVEASISVEKECYTELSLLRVMTY